jgi:hypothetical protein
MNLNGDLTVAEFGRCLLVEKASHHELRSPLNKASAPNSWRHCKHRMQQAPLRVLYRARSILRIKSPITNRCPPRHDKSDVETLGPLSRFRRRLLTLFKQQPDNSQNNGPEFSYIADVHFALVLAMRMHSRLSEGESQPSIPREDTMRSELVFGAMAHISNRFLLMKLASKATRKFHRPNTRIEDTTNEVFVRVSRANPIVIVPYLPQQTAIALRRAC